MPAPFRDTVQAADNGNEAAVREVFATLYAELHQLADAHVRRQNPDFSLGTTTLLHSAYLQMSTRALGSFPDKARFFAYASRVMRGLVIDRVRSRQAVKRGGGFEFVTLQTGPGSDLATEEHGSSLDGLSAALEHLARLDPSLAELVDLHFFCGFSFAEIAELRGVSDRTVQRDWRKARLLLAAEIDQCDRDTTTPANPQALTERGGSGE